MCHLTGTEVAQSVPVEDELLFPTSTNKSPMAAGPVREMSRSPVVRVQGCRRLPGMKCPFCFQLCGLQQL